MLISKVTKIEFIYLCVLHNNLSLQYRLQSYWNTRFRWVWSMKTQLSVAFVFVLCGIGIKTAATDCISRKEFDDFKANVLNHIQELTLKNDKQAKEIEYQKKAILDLKRMLIKYDETSNNLNQNDTAVPSNQSLPGESLMLSTKDSLKPPRKREAMRKCFYFYRYFHLLKNVFNFVLLKKS